MVLKCEHQLLPREVCINLDILRQGIKTPPGVCTTMFVISDTQVLSKRVKKNKKPLKKVSYKIVESILKKIEVEVIFREHKSSIYGTVIIEQKIYCPNRCY